MSNPRPKPPLRRQQQRCSVPNCYYATYRYDDDNVSYFKVPKEPNRAKLWFEAIGRPANPRLLVCELHFTKNYISIINDTRKLLVGTAVPTLNLPPRAPIPPPAPGPAPASAPAPASPAGPSQTTQSFDPDPPIKLELPEADLKVDIFVKEETVVSQKRPHEATAPSSFSECPIKREKPDPAVTMEQLAEVNRLIALANTHLEPQHANYIKALLLQKASPSCGKEHDENLSFLALELYHAFPQTYKLMQMSLGLPSIVQIKRLFRALRWETDEHWTRLLRMRFVDATPEQRECVVMAACAPLRPALAYAPARDCLHGLHELGGARRPLLARQAALLVARGIHARWQQPLACSLLGANTSHTEIRVWIRSVIVKLFAVGLTVRAVITDFNENFVPTGPIVTVERPYFTVDNKQIYCFYDCTQLITSFRNYFLEYNVNFGGLMASWEDIEQMHEYNSTRAYPLPTGLTGEHVRPKVGGPARRRARLAVEALARPVAAALAAAVDLRVLDDTAHGTVQVVSAVADLYDTMHNKALCGETSDRDKGVATNEVKFLNEMITCLEKMSLVDKASGQVVGDPGVLAALRAGVHAALMLHERARRSGTTTLPMRAFNNDPLQDFFDRQRARHRNTNPTSQQMLAAFRRSFVFNIMKSFKALPEDGQLEEFLGAASKVRSVPRAPLAPGLGPMKQWSVLLRVARRQRYGSALRWYLLERCLRRHSDCDLAREFCSSQQLPTELLRYMELMSEKFTSYFEHRGAEATGLLAALLEQMAHEPFEAPCACFPTDYLKTMYFHSKIYELIVFNNDKIRKNPSAELSLSVDL